MPGTRVLRSHSSVNSASRMSRFVPPGHFPTVQVNRSPTVLLFATSDAILCSIAFLSREQACRHCGYHSAPQSFHRDMRSGQGSPQSHRRGEGTDRRCNGWVTERHGWNTTSQARHTHSPPMRSERSSELSMRVYIFTKLTHNT